MTNADIVKVNFRQLSIGILILLLTITSAFGMRGRERYEGLGRYSSIGDYRDGYTNKAFMSFTGTDTGTLTPQITFSAGTIDVYKNSVYHSALTSTVAGSIAVVLNDVVQYVMSNPGLVTVIDMGGDAISGNIDQFNTLTALTDLQIDSTGIDWVDSSLQALVLMTNFKADGLGFSAANMNALMASLRINEAAGGAARNCTVVADGTNAAPTGQGLADTDLLVGGKGWTITLTGGTAGYVGMDALGNSTIDPLFVFSSGTVIPYIDGVAGTALTSGVDGSIAVTDNQRICYVYSNPANVTQIQIYDDSIDGNISGWTLPASLQYFYVNSTSLSGNISGWTLPASLKHLQVNTTSVSGDISGWTLPASLVTFYVHTTSLSGDISGWTFPASLAYFSVHTTSVSGDISGWTLPASLQYFYVSTTSVSGDISGWTLPASLQYFYVHTTSVDYDATSGPFTDITTGLTKIDFDNCNLTETQVGNILTDLDTANVTDNATIKIAGNNAAPSAAIIAGAIANLVGRGYTVNYTAP